MDIEKEFKLMLTRRTFFARTSVGIGTAALASLLDPNLFAETAEINPKTGGLKGLPHFTPKAKRVIFLHQSGAPSQIELFDYKPQLDKLHATLSKLLAEPAVRERLEAQSCDIIGGTPEALTELVKAEQAKWGSIIRDKNITVD